MKKICIFGDGQIAELAKFYFETDTNFEVSLFIVDDNYVKSSKFCNLPIIALSEFLKKDNNKDYDIFVAIGYNKLNRLREEKVKFFLKNKFELSSYVSSKATVLNENKIGKNCFILENNVIQPFVKICDNNFLWSGNHIGHHSVINDNCFISSHVVISGGVNIGNNCFIGVNSTLRDNIKVGNFSFIGAGSRVFSDIEECAVISEKKSNILKIKSDQIKTI